MSMMVPVDGKREVLAHHRALQTNIADVLKDLEDCESQELKAKLLAVQTAAYGIGDYLSTKIEAIYYNEHRKAASVAARNVFNIPELLECILEKIEVADIMRCYGVCRAMRDTINASPKLKIKLFLMPGPEESAVVRPLWLPNYDDFDFLETSFGKFLATVRTLRGSSTSLPTLGSRWKRTLVRQPPIRSMIAYVICDCDPLFPDPIYLPGNPYKPGVIDIQSDTGITVGDLFKAAERLFEAHRDCPLDDDVTYRGYRQRLVEFEGPLELVPHKLICDLKS